MKLRCDRVATIPVSFRGVAENVQVFPCQTCIKRGLEGICPEGASSTFSSAVAPDRPALGSLVTGRGTRYVLASTEALHEKIQRMAERIRQLEEALRILHFEHSACGGKVGSASAHPLLRDELLRVKGQYELYGLDSPTSPHALQHEVNTSTDGPQLRGPLVSAPMDSDTSDEETESHLRSTSYMVSEERRPKEQEDHGRILPRPSESNLQMASRLRLLLPDRSDAERLYSAAYTNAVWM